MYVYEEIDQSEIITTGYPDISYGTKNKKFPVIEEFSHKLIDKLNETLARLKMNHPFVGDFRFVIEKSSPVEELNTFQKNFCLDFYIEGTTKYGSMRTRGYRLAAPVAGSKAVIGIRSLSDKNTAWQGEEVHNSGVGSLFGYYNVNSIGVTVPLPALLVEGQNRYTIGGKISILLTECHLFIFSHRVKYPQNIISVVMFNDVLQENNHMFLANGFPYGETPIDKSSKWPRTLNQTYPEIAPRTWLREIYLQDERTKDVYWFCPGLYRTAENKVLHTSESLLRFINPSTGLLEEREGFFFLGSTFLYKKDHLLAVL